MAATATPAAAAPGTSVVEAEGGLPAVRMVAPNADTALVYLHGATVASAVIGGIERIFMSSSAVYNGAKALRGGIPVCAPQFGKPADGYEGMPQHGVCRISPWTFGGGAVDDAGTVVATFGLAAADVPEAQRASFPYAFGFTYVVRLGNGSIACELTVENAGSEAFRFQCLLHTYLRVPHISHARVLGLKGSRFFDKVANTADNLEERGAVTVTSEVDRVYSSVANDVCVSVVDPADPSAVRVMTVSKTATSTDAEGTTSALPVDVVVWNIWERAVDMADMQDDGFNFYVCVEPGVTSWTSVPAGGSVTLSQVIRAW